KDRRALIRFGRLAVGAVAARDEHAGERALAVGDVKVPRYVMIRPALVDDLLDAEAVALERARDLGVERRLLVGEPADRGDELGLQFRLPLVDPLRRIERCHELLAR